MQVGLLPQQAESSNNEIIIIVSHEITWYYMISLGITWYYMISWGQMMLVDDMLLCAGWPTAMAESSDRWGHERPVKAWENEPAVGTDSIHFWSYWDTSWDGLGVCWGAREWGVCVCVCACVRACACACRCACVHVWPHKADLTAFLNQIAVPISQLMRPGVGWTASCTLQEAIKWKVMNEWMNNWKKSYRTAHACPMSLGMQFLYCKHCKLIYRSDWFLNVAVWYQEHQEISCPQWQSCLHSGQPRCLSHSQAFSQAERTWEQDFINN